MTYTNIGICSNALLKIGAEGITSFEDGTAEAEIAYSLYPLLRDGLLSAYPPRLANVPVADYQYAYLLPNDFLRVISAGSGSRGRGIEYRILENRLHTDAPDVTISYIFRPHESAFPAFFCEALIARLAAEFCLPLTESTSRAELLGKLAEDAIAKARLTDAQQGSPRTFEDFSLMEARL